MRAEQGPDAVILSSRRVDEGIEVIAAVDYDEALFADATRQRTPRDGTATAVGDLPAPQPPSAADTAPPRRAPSRAAAAQTHAAGARCADRAARAAPRAARAAAPCPRDGACAASRPAAAIGDMQRELKDLRELLESGFAAHGAGTTSGCASR